MVILFVFIGKIIVQTERTRRGSHKAADLDISRGDLHQQHQRDAVQERFLRGRWNHLSGGNKVRSKVWRRFLEQFQVTFN